MANALRLHVVEETSAQISRPAPSPGKAADLAKTAAASESSPSEVNAAERQSQGFPKPPRLPLPALPPLPFLAAAREADKQERPRRRDIRHLTPGKSVKNKRLDEMLRVDHAGEFGATRIYAGQLAVFSRRPGKEATTKLVQHMAEQEAVHKETFDRILQERRVRPTALHPFWNVAGYALGAGTALIGEKGAMACTAAVESVIDEHYAEQYHALKDAEPELAAIIEQFRLEELEHHDTAIEEGAEQAPAYKLLNQAIKTGCRLAIRLSEKI